MLEQAEYMLSSMLKGLEYRIVSSGADTIGTVKIHDISADSRLVNNGTLFVAKKTASGDGHDYIDAAIKAGCTVFAVEKNRYNKDILIQDGLVVIEVDDSIYFYGQLVAAFYGNPSESLHIIGVTGTNGKTTITYLLENMLTCLGRCVGIIGTVNNRYTGRDGKSVVIPTSLTTPDAKIIQSLLRKMVDAGVTDLVMEVSSHAISQGRIAPLSYDIAIFTNLSRDHLDYHGNMDEYFVSKLELFSRYLKKEGCAVIPSDERSLRKKYRDLLMVAVSGTVVTWGQDQHSDITLSSYKAELEHTLCEVILRRQSQKKYSFFTPLVGRFNIDNLMTIIAVADGLGVSTEKLQGIIKKMGAAPGRLQRIVDPSRDMTEQPVVFVDYAHTPDALEKLILTLSDLPHKRLITIFGCGGDRDRGKRPLMGGIAARLSDIAILTEDNPRTEESQGIFDDIVKGVQAENVVLYENIEALLEEGKGAVLIANRGNAIDQAIRIAKAGDIVVIAGKGHEPYQLGKNGKIFFDDSLKALAVLCSWTSLKITHATNGQLIQATTTSQQLLGSITTDSRNIVTGSVFVALRGENHDGHAYLKRAVQQGAKCVVVEKMEEGLDCDQVIVEDTLVALGNLAHTQRMSLAYTASPQIVGITGSSGKTTIKEMAASIARTLWPVGPVNPENVVVKTEGNFNNLIGLPLSIFPMDVHTKVAILEMGMNCFGEIARLADIAQPNIACIGNVHGAHLAGLGSIEGVAQAKEELFTHAPLSSKLVINLDDPFIAPMSTKYSQEKITFSCVDEKADVYATHSVIDKNGFVSFDIFINGDSQTVSLHTYGEYNIANALAAAAIGLGLGANIEQIVQGLEAYRTPAKRMEKYVTKGGWSLLCDCYNANPASMAAGLKTLVTIGSGKKVAILGDMFELGDSAEAGHRDIGKLAGVLNIDALVVVGDFANIVGDEAVKAGLFPDNVHVFENKNDLSAWLVKQESCNWLQPEDVVLLKASRGMAMESLMTPFVEDIH